MAWEPSEGGGDDGGADGLPHANRWPSHDKVYRRRSFKRPCLGLGSRPDAAASTTASAGADDVSPSHVQPDPALPPLLPAPGDSPLVNDSSSLKQQEPEPEPEREPEPVPQPLSPPTTLPATFEDKEEVVDGYVRIRVSAWSRREIRELRRRLADELERVRSLLGRLEPVSAEPMQPDDVYKMSITTVERPVEREGHPDIAASLATPRRPQITVSVAETVAATDVVTPVVEKEKRTPKANQFYRNSDFILGKEKLKLTQESNRKSKSNGGGPRLPPVRDKPTARAFKQCMNLVSKLIRHRYGWVFDKPVDVRGLGLHDYYDIIKHPMDLGTVKSRLEANWYHSPGECAADVRLTFRNAMKYNPETQDVHVLAKQLLNIFEEKWADIEFEYSRNLRFESSYGVGPPTYMMKKTKTQAPPPELRRTWDWSEPAYAPTGQKAHIVTTPTGRVGAPKKPKAKDPNKRDMTFEEKQKLGMNLLKLPPEKQENVIQIIQRRNSEVQQHDDGIEVDIDSFDAETLWELDRLVTNYKKSLSKIKRRAELAQARRESNASRMNPVLVNVKAQKEIRTDGKDASHALPVQGENNGENGSISSTSSSSSSDSESSSSDSDSESSSTDTDGGHSPKT